MIIIEQVFLIKRFTNRPIDYHTIDERVVEPSSFLHSINYITIQSITDKKRSIGFSSLLDLVVPPLELLLAALGGLLVHLLCLYLLSLCLRKWLKKPKGPPRLQTKILAFFFLLFCFFFDEFYNGKSKFRSPFIGNETFTETTDH